MGWSRGLTVGIGRLSQKSFHSFFGSEMVLLDRLPYGVLTLGPRSKWSIWIAYTFFK